MTTKPTNQCMGCQAGWPFLDGVESGTHSVIGGYPHERVACTRDRYIMCENEACVANRERIAQLEDDNKKRRRQCDTMLRNAEQIAAALSEACEQAEDLLDELEEKRIRTATSVRAQERISELRKLATP